MKFILSPEGSRQGGNLVTDGFSGNPLVWSNNLD
jgi:hypothetical protein